MKYPKLRAEWIPVENPEITHQVFKAYKITPSQEEGLPVLKEGDDQPKEGDHFVLTSEDGTVRVYVLCDGSEIGAPATGTVLTEGSDIGAGTLSAEVASKGVCVAVLNNLKTHPRDLVLNEIYVAILHPNGHDGKISVENKELVYENNYDPDKSSAEFFVPAWDNMGGLLTDPFEILVTVQAISDTFPSEVISSEAIQLSAISIGNPSNLEVFVMPFPENYEEHEVSMVPASGVV